LVFYSSTITMMHGPINIRYIACVLNEFIIAKFFRSIWHTFPWEMPNIIFFFVLWSKWASTWPSKQLRLPCLPQQDKKKQN